VRARVAAGHVLAAVHQIELGRGRLAEAATIAGGEPQLVKPVLLAEVELATRQGDFTRALVLLDELRAVVHAASDEHEEHRVALHLAQSHAAVGNRATAIASLQEAERLLPHDAAAALERKKVSALVDYFTRDFRSAALRSEEAIELGREMDLAHEVMLNLHNLGDILVHLDDLPRAFGAVQQSLALCEECGDERFANYNRMLLAFLEGIQGGDEGTAGRAADEGGEKRLRQGIAYAESKEFTWDVIGGRLLLAKLLCRLDRRSEAHGEFERTRALALGAGHRLVADDCEVALENLAGRGASQVGASVPVP
jgi:tetratricopeptide (TPR) repeat protein